MDEKKLIEVYNFFTEEGYDLGGFDKFKSDLLIESPQREEIYMRFDGDGYDIGDFNDFFYPHPKIRFPYRELVARRNL